MKKIHMRDPGYVSATGAEIRVGPVEFSEVFRRAICSLEWRHESNVAHRWRRVTCSACRKKMPNAYAR